MNRLRARLARDFEDALARAGNSRAAGAGPMQNASSASRTCGEFSSASEYTATEPKPHALDGSQDAARDGAAIGDQDFS